jgi:hypothetical protein
MSIDSREKLHKLDMVVILSTNLLKLYLKIEHILDLIDIFSK